MHACMHAGPALSWKPIAPEEKMRNNYWKLNIYACMHACWAIPQLEAGCTWAKNGENWWSIKMHACMQGYPSAGSRMHLKENVEKNNEKLNIYACMHACMHACMLSHPSVGSRLHLRKKCGKNQETSNIYSCMHACWAIPQLEAGCAWGKNAEKIMKNQTYMHACMHAGPSLSWKPVAPEEKMRKNIKQNTYVHACMLRHPSAGSRLHLREKMQKKWRKIRRICMNACMLGHPSSGSRLYLRKNAETNLKRYTYMHACMHAGSSLSCKPVAP